MINKQREIVSGEMNAYTDKYPETIIATCEIIGTPLPDNAIFWGGEKAPSHYIKKEILTGTLKNVKKVLGKNMPVIEEEELKDSFKKFKWKYKSQNNIKYTDTDFVVYFCDWLLFARDRGFSYSCYFDYELYNKEWKVRDTFLNEGYRQRVWKACSTKSHQHYLANKAHFNQKFEKFVKRDWIDASTCTLEEFKKFANKHERFFGKPVKGTGGFGAKVIERDSASIEELYEICHGEELILEELICQHPSLEEFNASTLNTVRVTTLLCADDKPRIVLATARFGRKGKDVDNFHGGGVGAVVDIESGLLISEAINRKHERSAYHPDSKKEILGFQYPEWEKVKAAVCEAATMLPEMRNIGWDVAVTKEGEIEFVEGNGRPNYDVLQSPDQVGRRFRYEPYLSEIEKMKGITPQELEPIKIKHKNKVLQAIKINMKKAKRKIRRICKKYIKNHIVK